MSRPELFLKSCPGALNEEMPRHGVEADQNKMLHELMVKTKTDRDRVYSLQAEKRGLAAELDAARSQHNDLLAQLQLCQADKANVETALAKLAARYAALKKRKEELKNESATLQATIDGLKEQLEDEQRKLTRAQKKWEHEKTLLTQDRDGYKEQLDALRDKVSSLSRELAASEEGADAHKRELQEQLDKAEREMARAKRSWASEKKLLEQDRDGYKEQVTTLRDKVSLLSRQAAGM